MLIYVVLSLNTENMCNLDTNLCVIYTISHERKEGFLWATFNNGQGD